MKSNANTQSSDCTNPALGNLLESYAIGTLSANDAEQFEEHYFECNFCRERLEASKAVLTLIGQHQRALQAQLLAEGRDYLSLRRAQRLQRQPSLLQTALKNLISVLTSRTTIAAGLASLLLVMLPQMVDLPWRHQEALPLPESPSTAPSHKTTEIIQPESSLHETPSTVLHRETSPLSLSTSRSAAGTAQSLPLNLSDSSSPLDAMGHAGSKSVPFSLTPNSSERIGQATSFEHRTVPLPSVTGNANETANLAMSKVNTVGNPTPFHADANPFILVDLKGLTEKKRLELPADLDVDRQKRAGISSRQEINATVGDPPEQIQRQKALSAYKKKNYKEAIELWFPLIASGTAECADQLYAGVSAYLSNDYLNATDFLAPVYATGGCSDSMRIQGTWYYANALLNLKEYETARLVLNDLAGSRIPVPERTRDQAVKILNKLDQAMTAQPLSKPK